MRAMRYNMKPACATHLRLPGLRHEASDVVVELERHERAVQRPVVGVVLLRTITGESASRQARVAARSGRGVPELA